MDEYARTELKPERLWKEVSRTDSAFYEEYRPISTDPSLAINFLSKSVRSIIEELAAMPPRVITVLMENRCLVAYKSDEVLSVEHLNRFVIAGMELADPVL